MPKRIKEFVAIGIFTLFPVVLLWLPFFLRLPSVWGIPIPDMGMASIVSNFDGPLYMVVSKTFYDKPLIEANYQFPLPSEYYAAHFPLFPALIRLFSLVTNFPYAMLSVTLVSSFISIYFFKKLADDYFDESSAYFLTFVFSVLPARWLIVRTVGSADPLFVASIIASVYYFKHKNYLPSGIWGMIAQLTKSAGILLFISYFIYLTIPNLKMEKLSLKNILKNFNLPKTLPIFLIPTALIAVFSLYYFRTGDFWAYFNSGDNIHLGFPPFQIFNYASAWVGTSWLEEILFIYAVGAVGVLKLIRMKEFELATFAGVFYFFILFVSHRDILRYFLPVVPFLFIAFGQQITKKAYRPVFLLLLLPVYLFAVSFISQNVMPISNWAPFL